MVNQWDNYGNISTWKKKCESATLYNLLQSCGDTIDMVVSHFTVRTIQLLNNKFACVKLQQRAGGRPVSTFRDKLPLLNLTAHPNRKSSSWSDTSLLA